MKWGSNIMLSSLALVITLRMLLSITYGGESFFIVMDSLTQSMAYHHNHNQHHIASSQNHAGRQRGGATSKSSSRSNAAAEIPSTFTIRPNRTFALYHGGSILETFHSFVPLPNNMGYQLVYKVNKKDDTITSRRAQSIETMELSPTFERNETTRKELGVSSIMNSKETLHRQTGLSDPRAFFWNNSAYALTWKVHRHDHANFLFNLVTGEQFPLNDCIRGYRGKNWVPLVYHEQLYIIHRLSPHLTYFKYDAHDGCPEPNEIKATKNSIDEWRGGSNFVPFGPTSMIALGHRTINGDTHVPYLIHVDMRETKIRRGVRKIQLLTQEKNWSGILDPTSLWWDEDGKLWMGSVRTSGSWKKCYFKDTAECVFNMTIYEVELKYKYTG